MLDKLMITEQTSISPNENIVQGNKLEKLKVSGKWHWHTEGL
jgi:hypothetical protein